VRLFSRRGAALLGSLLATIPACRTRPTRPSDDAGPAVLAPNDLSAPKKPPPLRAGHLAPPSLPDLPSLTAHEPPAQPPKDADLTNTPCHAVWTGNGSSPLACASSLLFGARPSANNGGGATLLVPRTLLARDPAMLPAISDHRLEGTEGPVRNQGSAPACSAFATATAIDHAILRWSGRSTPSSSMQIWARYHSPSVETSLLSNVGEPIGAEQGWPFNASEAVTWMPCSDMPKGSKSACGVPVNASRLAALEANPIGVLTEVEYIPTPVDTPTLQAKIASGQDIIVAIELPSAFVPKGRAGSRYIPHYKKSEGPNSGHAFVLAGYVHFAHGTYFLLHNSWGTGWGDGGYAWIHEATIAAWAHDVVAVDAEPLERDPSSRAKRNRGTTTCSAGMLPDSIRATCTPPCPDGSPRHDDVCAVGGQCPASYVNLSGACVLAAPAVKGSDPSTGVTWTCGPGGCAYTLPRASDPTCTGATCEASCPAPDFHLANMAGALVCVE
jgi:hypothetical protein